mmetsp:Transcript_21691/g.55479  ORF Transcript_21691/g.55479 Transcript_21691/m.55479 type:complete len:92 (+) Transcript_21691:60-335(+)
MAEGTADKWRRACLKSSRPAGTFASSLGAAAAAGAGLVAAAGARGGTENSRGLAAWRLKEPSVALGPRPVRGLAPKFVHRWPATCARLPGR